MMHALGRLRRSVALMICPELAGGTEPPVLTVHEARLSAARAGGFFEPEDAHRAKLVDQPRRPAAPSKSTGFERAVERLVSADDKFAETVRILADLRAENLAAAGDDDAFLGLVVSYATLFSLPVRGGQR